MAASGCERWQSRVRGFRVEGAGFRVEGLEVEGCRVEGLGFTLSCVVGGDNGFATIWTLVLHDEFLGVRG